MEAKQSRVYTYGLFEPTKNRDLVIRQIELADAYYNMLIEIERRRRKRWRELMAEQTGCADIEAEIERLTAERDDLRARIKSGEKDLKPWVRELGAKLKDLRAKRKEARDAAKHDPIVKMRAQEIDARALDEKKASRADFISQGLYWGTYLLSESAADAASKQRTDPRFRRHTGDGAIGVQIQGGVDAKSFFGDDRRLQIAGVGRPGGLGPKAWDARAPRGQRRRDARTVMRIRVGSEGRDPIWADFPMIMHRPLPEGAVVKWAKVIRRRRAGERFEWELQLSVQYPQPKKKAPRRVVGLDVGWRWTMEDKLRVGYLSDGRNDHEITTPAAVRGRIEKADSIRGIRDRGMNELRGHLVPMIKGVKVWEEVGGHIHLWKDPRRFIKLLDRADVSDDARELLDAWRRRDLHLEQYEEGTRKRAYRRRRDHYRCIAAWLVQNYDAIVVEDFDLSKVVTAPVPESDRNASPTPMQRLRSIAAPHELRQCIESAAAREGVLVVRVPSENTTSTCHACGSLEDWDHAEDLWHRCSACGEAWDQDLNAARNILARGQEMLADEEMRAALMAPKVRAAKFAKRHKPKKDDTKAA